MWAVRAGRRGSAREVLGWSRTRSGRRPRTRTAAGTTRGDDGPSTPHMTAAGVATLFITQDYLIDAHGRDCKGNSSTRTSSWAWRGWTSTHRRADAGRATSTRMYGVERIGVASGRKYFGNARLVPGRRRLPRQAAERRRRLGRRGDDYNASKIPNTCFALLFLARGRAPVMMNKLEYASGRQGRRRESRLEPAAARRRQRRPLDGQADLDGRSSTGRSSTSRRTLDELHDAPILYIAGSEALDFKHGGGGEAQAVRRGGRHDPRQRRLRQRERSPTAFKALGEQLFPAYEFRELPDNHPIFTSQQFNASQVEEQAATSLG